ncbi:MAG: cyclic nucleotide-binding domain-containing protein [Desulfobacterales bacterium]
MIESDYLEESAKLVRTLRGLPTLGPFGEKELRSLLKQSKIRKYRAGETIIREGRIDTWIYFLVYGRVTIEKDGELIARIDRQGDTIGEMSILDRSNRSASAIAETDTVCLATDTRYIDRLTGLDRMVFCAVLYRIIAEILADRLRTTSLELIREREKRGWKFWKTLSGYRQYFARS